MKTENQFEKGINPVLIKDKFLTEIRNFSDGKPIHPQFFENLSVFLVESMSESDDILMNLFLKALESHSAYLHPDTRRRREVYLRNSCIYCLSKILDLNIYDIAKLLNKSRSNIILILQRFEESLKYNKMVLNYFRGYLSSLMTELKNELNADFESVFLDLVKAKGVDEVLSIVLKIRDRIEK